MQAHYWQDRLVTEGAAATPLAAILAGRFTPAGPTALILTGRNVDMDQFTRVVTGQPVTLGPLTVEGAPACRMTSCSSPKPTSAAPSRSTSPPIDVDRARLRRPRTRAASSCPRSSRWRCRR